MKITIDTKEDSEGEIRGAIQLLSGCLVGENRFKGVRAKEMKSGGDFFSSGSENSGNAFVNMFGSGEAVEGKKEEEVPVDLSVLSNPKEEQEEDDDGEVPGVVSY